MGYFRRTSNYLEIILLFDPTHMMSMIDFVAIGVEKPKIDSGIDPYEALNGIIPYCQSGQFMSQLCM